MSELGDPLEPEHAYWLFKKDPEDFDVGRLRLSSGKEVLWTGDGDSDHWGSVHLLLILYQQIDISIHDSKAA